jgi:hypothetical protein
MSGGTTHPPAAIAGAPAPWPSLWSVSGRPEPPPPLEANDQLVTALVTVGWAVTLVVLLIVHGDIPPRERWWIWTAVTGLGMGLFGLVYVPHLKRSRERAARRRGGQPWSSDSKTVSSTEKPG